MKKVLQYANWLLFVVAIAEVFIAVAFVFLMWAFGLGREIILYPLAFNFSLYEDIGYQMVLVFLGGGVMYFALNILSPIFGGNKANLHRGARAVFLMIFALGFLFCVPIVLFWQRSTFWYWGIVTENRLNNQMYRLAEYSPDPVEGDFLLSFVRLR